MRKSSTRAGRQESSHSGALKVSAIFCDYDGTLAPEDVHLDS
jgi:hypothetical protein